MNPDLPARFRTSFFQAICSPQYAGPLKDAALAGRLGDWTRVLTSVSVESCHDMGWQASAKSHKLDLLPIRRSEYLCMDVMAFPKGDNRWQFPAAVMELENQSREDFIAYSLWKLLSVRTQLRVLFCYRKEAGEAGALRKHLQEQVIDAMGIGGRVALEGKTVLVIGRKAEVETFPHGFFGWWELDTNTGRFESF